MGTINEKLVLTDNFSSPMKTVESMLQQASASAIRLDNNLTRAMGRSAGATIGEIRKMHGSMEQTNELLERLIQKQKKHTNETERTESKWKKLTNTIRNTAIVTGGIALVKNIAAAADQQSNLNSRIKMMNDGLQSTEELQKMIYNSAQNSRGSYANTANMVGKFGTLAPDAFGSSQEIVNFAEQINKHLTLSGTSSSGADAAILQLTQAMGAGVLRGEELNSILEQTPTIAQTIAEYMGVSVGEMRKLASEGQITSNVVKNALFATADETNAKFEEMPMTFAQLWQSGLNAVQQAAMPVLQMIAKGATFIHDNWDTISPILLGVAVAAGVVAVALGAQAAAAWIAKAANEGLFASLLTNPLTWIALAVGVVVAVIYKWIQSVGGITVAWMITKNYVLTAWEEIQIGFMTGVFAVQNWLDMMHLKFTTIGVNIANAAGDMKVNVLTQIENMVNGAIDLLNKFISSVNKIPGVAIELIDNVSFAASASASNEAAKAARASELAGLQSQVEANAAARESQLAQMQAEAQAKQGQRLSEIASKKAEIENAAGVGNEGLHPVPEFGNNGKLGDIGSVGSVGKVKNVEGSVNLSDEDLKIYRDLAERRYMNQIELKTLAPNVNVTLPAGAGGNLTAGDVADHIRKMLIQEMASSTAVSHR